MVFTDGFPDAFHPKAMSPFIGFMSGRAAMGIHERICTTGIYDGYYNKRRACSPVRIDFDKGLGNAAGSFQRIV